MIVDDETKAIVVELTRIIILFLIKAGVSPGFHTALALRLAARLAENDDISDEGELEVELEALIAEVERES